MKPMVELKLEPVHRTLGEIAAAIAEKDMKRQALRVKTKEVADGYKEQAKKLDAELNRLRAEYMAASIAAEGSR
jgi:uncharacterized protein YqgV (UPF0045/DUF77 family)